jgi:hypothetical protein
MERDHNCKLRSKLGQPALGQHACFPCVTGDPFGALLFSIHRSAWKVDTPKSGYLIGQGLIHVLGSLCSTTICSPSHAARVASEGILAPLGRRSMHDPANGLARIHLLETVLQIDCGSRFGPLRSGSSACYSGKPAQHNPAHGPQYHRHPILRQPLVVFRQPPSVAEPREGPLHHPPPRQDHEPARLLFQPVAPQLPGAMARYLHLLSSLLFGPPAEPTRVRPVCPQQHQPR